MFALPPPGTHASTSIWERRKATKSCSTSDAEVEQNVLSLLLLDSSIDDVEFGCSSPVSLHSPVGYSPWSTAPDSATFRSSSPIFSAFPAVQRSRSFDQAQFGTMEMHTAQLAVKSALEVLDEPPTTLRIATHNSLGLSAPNSPALSSPTSPAESCFSDSAEVGGEVKKKGRARMSQEKRKRLARRREREALLNAISEQSRSAPVTLTYFPTWDYASPRREEYPPSPALTHGRAGSATPDSSPVNAKGELGASSPPRLVVQPPSPQRVRGKDVSWNSTWSAGAGMHSYASVY